MRPALAAFALMLLAPSAAAAQPVAEVVEADDAAIVALIGALYAAISGPAGPRDWDKFKALFVPEGRLVPVGDGGPRVLSQQDYIDRAGPLMMKEGFFESEVARRIEHYGNIAHVFSTYESRHTPDGRPFARGINSIQVVRAAGQWRILSISWQGETPSHPVPDAYLKAPARR